jgi:CheY-like chemotaxis protein
MNQLAMRPIVIRKEKTAGFHLNEGATASGFWNPVKPFIAPFLMTRKLTQPELSANIEQMAPANVAVYPLSILVVEDNRINRVLTMKMLSHLGYAADAVVNGRECMQAMTLKYYDLYLMDLQMPVMDGFTAAREIRRWHQINPVNPPPYICALTANVMAKDREECLAAGMDDFVAKPLRLETLRIVVTRVAENLKNFHGQSGQDLPT